MPVGATGSVTVQPVDSNVKLPADLTHKSADPTIIEVTSTGFDTFDMHALKKGTTNVEVWSAGAAFDWATFHVEPANRVLFNAETAVVAGGRMGLAVTDVFGACGTDKCPMFGHTFVNWTADPAASLTFLEDNENLAHYVASATSGKGDIVGKEPSEGGELVRFAVEIVNPEAVTSMAGMLIPPKTGETEPVPVVFPATVKPNDWFEVRVFGERPGNTRVAISRHDVEWVMPSDLSPIPQTEPADPYKEIFVAPDKPGMFTLTAKVALLGGMEKAFVVNVVSP